MTRPYAAKRLLEHGPLTFGAFRVITGWSVSVADLVLRRLVERDAVTLQNIDGRRHYVLC